MSADPSSPAYFGRYQVVEELGAGAMGVVYLCVDSRLARPVAVKVLRENELMSEAEREQFHARFRHEAEAAGRLTHPDIVQIYDIGPSYLVMEFLEGRALNAHLKAGGSFSVRQISSLVLRVADAIDYAHRHGIVHRDIKPANIMMMDDGSVKVLDFGVARLDSSNLTAAGTVVGSVQYMAPEQMMGERVDGRADVFSLAAVAYELLTGRAPFPGKTITEVVSRVVHGTHVPPREVDARFPEAVNGAFARAFAVDVGSRTGRAMDFARELYEAAQPVLDMEVIHGTPTITPSSPTQVPVPGTTMQVAPGRGPRAVPARVGVLLLDSDPPRARVYLDGSPVGETPLSALEAPLGRHVVRMEAEGREAVSAEVELERDRPLRVLSFTLPVPTPTGAPVRPGQLVEFSAEVRPPQRISGAVPAYPPAALERGLEGAPVVDVWVGETGQVVDVAIVESAGALLDGAVLEAVAGWQFTPARLRGVPVSIRLTFQHLFRR
jgi:TonB family protein